MTLARLKALCAQDGVAETMRASLKAKLLADAPYSFEEACHELRTAADRLDVRVANAGRARDTRRAWKTSSAEGEGFADVCGGVCAGMVGANLVFWQDGTNFIAPINDWESHEIEFLDDEIRRSPSRSRCF